MDFIHTREYLGHNDIVVVNCSHQCNIILMDDINFANYKRGGQFQHYGGFFKMFPAKLPAPHAGNWNIVIDLGGRSANIRYSINVIRG